MIQFEEFDDENPEHIKMLEENAKVIFIDPSSANVRYGVMKTVKWGPKSEYTANIIDYTPENYDRYAYNAVDHEMTLNHRVLISKVSIKGAVL